ncbi:hypothetical protein [Halobaculum sp. MBLA0143]|uniref:hypothetical protein n=1 Tax=Halobaculum sp. MBLA0143 TaxID=3079933 RepID=UPI00352548CD
MSDRPTRRRLLETAGVALAGPSGCLQLSDEPTPEPAAATRPSPTATRTPTASATERDTDGQSTPDPTDSPTATDTPTDTPTQTARPTFTDGFERGTVNWVLEPLASDGATVTVADNGGYDDTRALRWGFDAAETTAYAVTRDPVVAPGQTLTVRARLPQLAERSPSVSLAGAGVFGTDGPGGLLQFAYSGWNDRLSVEANNTNTLGRRDAGGVLTSGGWLEFRVDWRSTDRLRFSVRDLQTDTRTPELSVRQSVLDSPAEIGLSVYNTTAGDPAFFDRVLVE